MDDRPRGSVPSGADESTAAAGSSRRPPWPRIGPYKILQLIGEGGMGEVWLAEQSEPMRRRVALKIIKRGMDTESVIARFEAERQALALMNHPAVARVYDAGSSPEGRPYFAMEYVEGEPITRYCDRHRLPLRERVALVQQVCAGIQHAHQKGIIHRDIKPSNVLVSIAGDAPLPKVIDFGVAKAIQQRLTERTLFTELGVMIGTPEYMSPEQAEAGVLDVDTRTDVYALGVMLYELLSGALPFDSRELRGAGLEAIRRRIRDEDPSRPSRRLSDLGERSLDIAAQRRTDPLRLAHSLEGDLDWITLKAMDKDRTRRYGSPGELAADLGRYLRDEPVQARPPSVRYKAGKFLRRHRLGVSVAALGLIGLIGFAGAMGWQARRIARERDRSEWVSRFLLDLFLAPDPEEARGNAPSAEDLLDRGARRIEADASGDPVLRAQMLTMLGRTYEGLGHYDKAERMLSAALEVQRDQSGQDAAVTVAAMHNLALVHWDLGRYEDAEALYREAIDAGRRVLGEDDPLTLTALANLGSTLSTLGRSDQAEAAIRQALEGRRRVRGPEHIETLASAADLALVWQQQGRYAEAESLLSDTVGRMSRVLGPDSPQTLKAEHNLAVTLNLLKRYAEAETHYERALEGLREVLGEEHPSTLTCMISTALNLASLQRFAAAESLMQVAVAEQERVLGERHPSTVNAIYQLACLAALEGKREAAFARLRQAVDQGYHSADLMARDADLESLHGDDRFEDLVELARAKGEAASARAEDPN